MMAQQLLMLNANSIQELQFVSGAFNAEYGKALSGYVNIATKDGDNTFTGSVTSYMGNNYSTHTDIFYRHLIILIYKYFQC